MRLTILLVILSVTTFLQAASFAHAQSLDSTHKRWKAFTTQQSTGKLCYIATEPTSESGNALRRSKPYVWIAAGNKDEDEVSVSSGFTYKAGNEVLLTVDRKSYKLFAQGDTAWSRDEATDKAIISAMRSGKKLTVKGSSEQGTYAEDSYSLSGVSAAYKRMKALCGK